jgi:histidyl-tRNA synthetase
LHCTLFIVSQAYFYVKIRRTLNKILDQHAGGEKMKNVVQPLKGTRDFYPELMAMRNFVYHAVQRISENYGYQEYEAPFLESINLYAAKSGEELVNQQSFVFPDRGGDLITLRPEMTPSLARMVAQRQNQLSYPLRWWSFGPFWRYEKPQKGRAREFFQWNIDLIGIDTAEADAELIALAANFFQYIGLSANDVVILVNDRSLMNSELMALGVSQDKLTDCLNLIDRRGKMEPSAWDAYAQEIGLNQAQLDGLKNVLADHDLWKKSEKLSQIFTLLEAVGVKDYIRYDPNIIRGLLYYTSIVFEAYDRPGEVRRSILGGGRYDNLLNAVGGDPLPAVGFAMGDMVISLLLEKYHLFPETLSDSPANVMVTVFDSQLQMASQKLAAELRQAGIKANCYPEVAKLPKQFKYADRIGVRFAAVIGPDEEAQGQVTIKDLKQGSQQTIARSEAAKTILALLDEAH